MNPRPEFKKCRTLASVVIIEIVAGIVLAISILYGLSVLGSRNSELHMSGVLIIIIGIVITASLALISNIASDIHYTKHISDMTYDETEWYHTESLRKLQAIETLLRQQHSQQEPYTPTFNTPKHPQKTNPQRSSERLQIEDISVPEL